MLSRRALLVSAAAAAAVRPAMASAQTAPPSGSRGSTSSTTVLQLQRRTIEVNGKPATVFAIRQPDGTSGIITEVGRPFRVHLENNIDQPSLIHWHGLTPPWQQDGVPDISAPPIPPGGSADYDFPLRFGGTFWMHSHEGLQEQSLMLAPLIIHDDRDRHGEQEVILMLNDFSFAPPDEIFAGLKKTGGMPNMAGRSPQMGSATGMAQQGAAAAPDLNDVKYDAFLANDRTLADPEVVKVEPGRRVLLRVINGSSMSNYHLDLGQLKGELIAVDGFRTAPMMASRFPIAVAQRLDIRLALPTSPQPTPCWPCWKGTGAKPASCWPPAAPQQPASPIQLAHHHPL
jgi:FtsP/CotA-like multicopper oxidase with cupredoxin domain